MADIILTPPNSVPSGTTITEVVNVVNASDIIGGTLSSNYGGAGTVTGILKANGAGIVSAATPDTDYATPASQASAVTAEANRASGVENSLSTALSTETSRAIAEETSLGGNIASEISRATGAESTLTSNLAAETSRAEAAEAACEKTANKGVANGYVPTDANNLIPDAYIPAREFIQSDTPPTTSQLGAGRWSLLINEAGTSFQLVANISGTIVVSGSLIGITTS